MPARHDAPKNAPYTALSTIVNKLKTLFPSSLEVFKFDSSVVILVATDETELTPLDTYDEKSLFEVILVASIHIKLIF